MSSSSTSGCTILDIPDEILVKIISYIYPRKRLSLANSCPEFYNLVFEDEVLSRDLDFSKDGRLTTAYHIQQYFGNANTRKLIRKINVQNVICLKPGRMLNNSIGRAINLVDINVHGIKFKDIKQLASFLEPLIHVKRLSLDWPKSKDDDVKMCSRFLEAPLERLTYFSVKVYVSSDEFLPNFKHCQELEELRMVTKDSRQWMKDMSKNLKLSTLKKLKIVQVRGWEAMQIKNHVVNMLPDLEEWTDFQLIDFVREPGFYFEKNVELCEELRERKLLKGSVPYQLQSSSYGMNSFLVAEYLLREVIGITHKDAPETFCCSKCLLKIDEAKRLLKDPRYQISFLYFEHSIESNCDAHLVASAFPNLTELVLRHIRKKKDKGSTSVRQTRFRRCLRRRDSSIPEEQDYIENADSSFELVVENTPHLRDLTIYAQHDMMVNREQWDLAALCSIPRWKNLTTLRLAYVPIKDGKFLIDIGKECTKLETLVLYYLRGNGNFCSYTIDLTQMLSHCKNLRELSIEEFYIDNMPEILASLSNLSKLRSLSLISTLHTYQYYKLEELISSIEELLRRCQRLTTLTFINKALYREDSEELGSALKRIRVELKRPNLQFQTAPSYFIHNISIPTNSETVYKDAWPFFFPRKFDGFN